MDTFRSFEKSISGKFNCLLWSKYNLSKIKCFFQFDSNVKHESGSNTVWGSTARNGSGKRAIINRIPDTKKDIDILRDNLFESVSNLGVGDFLFQQHSNFINTEWVTRVYVSPGAPNHSSVTRL